jgi:hypothetical protein
MERETNWGTVAKQGVASVFDIASAIPGAAGLVASLPLTAKEYLTTDKGLKDSFFSGLDNPATRLSMKMRDGTNDMLGIQEPQGGWENIARLASVAIPISATTKGADWVAKTIGAVEGGLGHKALQFGQQMLTPMAQYAPRASLGVKAAQVGAQVGLNVAADEGIRALTDQPTITSPGIGKDLLPEDNTSTFIFTSVLAGLGAYGAYAASRSLMKQDAALFGKVITEEGVSPTDFWDNADAAMVDKRMRVVNKMKAQLVPQDVIDSFINRMRVDSFGVASALVEKGGKIPNSNVVIPSLNKDIYSVYNALPDDKKSIIDNGMNAAREMVNRATALSSKIEQGQAGFSDLVKNISDEKFQLLGRVREKMMEAAKAGDANQAYKYHRQRKQVQQELARVRSMQYTGQYVGMRGMYSPADVMRMTIDEKMEMLFDLDQTLGSVKTGLFVDSNSVLDKSVDLIARSAGDKKGLPATTGMLRKAYGDLLKDPDAMHFVKKYGELTSGMLDYAVEKKIVGKAIAETWKKNNTLDGLMFYMPGREHIEANTNFLARTQALLGWNTPEANDFMRMWNPEGLGNFNQRAMNYGKGITAPIRPMESIQQYMASIIEHAQLNTLRSDALESLKADPLSKSFLTAKDKDLVVKIKDTNFYNDQNSAVYYVGTGTEQYKKLLAKSDGALDENNLIRISKGDKVEHWYVADPLVRNALMFAPNTVEGLSKIGAGMKNMVHNLTTRNILFAPVQFAMSAQQGLTLGMAHKIGYTPVDIARGTFEMLLTGMRSEAANFFDNQLRNNSILARFSPAGTQAIRDRLLDKVHNSFLMKMQESVGGPSSAYMTQDNTLHIPDLVNAWGAATKNPGILPTLWRLTEVLNRALQDGPLLGMQMKLVERELLNDPNDFVSAALRANSKAKDVTGDFRALGDSDLAKGMAAWIPYSGAMIHSWRAIGKAINQNPKAVMAGLMSTVALPTIAEMAIIEAVGTEQQKREFWSASDGMRIGNFAIPKPSGDGLVWIPLTPEFTPFRVAVQEAIDGVFSLSKRHRTYPMAGLDQENVDVDGTDASQAFAASVARIFNISAPPIVNMGAAMMNKRMSFGYDPASESPIPIFNVVDLKGEQVGGYGRGFSTIPNSDMSTELMGFINAGFGGVGGILGGMYATMTSRMDNAGAEDIPAVLEATAAAGMKGATNLSKPLSLFSGELSRTSRNLDFNNELNAKMNGVKNIQLEATRLLEGQFVGPDGFPRMTDALMNPGMMEAPMIASELQMAAPEISYMDTEIRAGLGNLSLLEAGSLHAPFSNDKFGVVSGEPLTPDRRRALSNSINQHINAMRLAKLYKLQEIERRIAQSTGNPNFRFEEHAGTSVPLPLDELSEGDLGLPLVE